MNYGYEEKIYSFSPKVCVITKATTGSEKHKDNNCPRAKKGLLSTLITALAIVSIAIIITQNTLYQSRNVSFLFIIYIYVDYFYIFITTFIIFK